jgi:hypothetical protein
MFKPTSSILTGIASSLILTEGGGGHICVLYTFFILNFYQGSNVNITCIKHAILNTLFHNGGWDFIIFKVKNGICKFYFLESCKNNVCKKNSFVYSISCI